MDKSRMTGKITICRADEAEALNRKLRPVAMLSIEHPEAEPGKGAAPRLTDGTTQMILSFWDAEHDVPGGPDIEQVEQGIAFIVENILKGDVIVHCHAGKARSCGIVLGALAQLYPNESEAALIDRLLEIRSIAAPNIIVVEMADQLAGRNGKLVKAVEDHAALTVARAKADEGRRWWQAQHPEKFPPRP